MTELTQFVYSPCGNSEGRCIPWSFESLDSDSSAKISAKNEKAKKISSNYPSNCIKNRYRKKANSYSIIYTHLHGCGSGHI